MDGHCCLICSESFDKTTRLRTVTSCNHNTVCSLCYTRVRALRRNHQCMTCKADLDVVICTPNDDKKFEDYEIWGEHDLGPQHVFDAKARMFFTKEYFKSFVEHLWQIKCQICGQSKRDVKSLKHHMSSEHNLLLCLLCIEHLYAFPSEIQVYTQATYDQHLRTGDGAGGTGHPLCQFCKKRFYDKTELFVHLSRDHFSCFLCEREGVQFQYFAEYKDVEEHFRTDHFLCEDPVCLGKRFVAFANDIDYLAHCRQHHPFATTSQVGPVTLGFHFGGSGSRREGHGGDNDRDRRRTRERNPSSAPSSSFSPFGSQIPQETIHTHSALTSTEDELERRRQLSHLHTVAAISSESTAIPKNMKVAGRIVGGRFVRDRTDDTTIPTPNQTTSTHMTIPQPQPSISIPPPVPRTNYTPNASFPQLSSTVKPTTEVVRGDSSTTPHPLSLVQQKQREAAAKRAAELEQKAIEAEIEEKRLARSKLMANAFGLSVSSAELGSGSNRDIFNTPLYPPMLISWAKKCRPELLKVEKKIAELFADKRLSSIQLKSMPQPIRVAVHGIARQVVLNSYEYDPEPKRYISLVKTNESRIPCVLLSTASTITYPPLPPLTVLHTLNQPTIYFSRKNPDAPYTVTPSETRVKVKAADIKGGLVTVDDVVSKVQYALKIAGCRRVTITGIRLANASTIALDFSDMIGALQTLYLVTVPSNDNNEHFTFFDGFLIEGAFDHEACVQLLASDNELKEGGSSSSSNDHDIIHRGAFGGGGADDGFGTRARDLGLPSSFFRTMPTSSSTNNSNTSNTNSSVSNVKEVLDRPVAGILKLDPSIMAELRNEWGEDEDDEKFGSEQIDNSNDSNSSSSMEVVNSSNSNVIDNAENDISDATQHDTVGSATEPLAVLDCGGGGMVDGLQAAIEEVKTAPPAPPATYRRLQLAPRTLPLSMPPMPVKVAAATTTTTADSISVMKANSSSSKSKKTAKNVKTQSHNETVKPVGNAFLMLGDDDDDDDETKEEPNNEKKQDLCIDDEDHDLISALLASEIEEMNYASTPLDVPCTSSGWSCKTCTLINEETENECKACGTPSSSGDDAAWQTAK